MSNTAASQAILPDADYHAADPSPLLVDTSQGVGLRVGVNVSVISGAGATVTVNVEGFDAATQTWQLLLASAGLTATGFVQLQVDPRIAASANLIAQKNLPPLVRVKPVKSGTTTTLQYSITADSTK